ncbi:hypothetical protein [Methylobacterium soli]|jgi:hypothetical protein|uniref:Uncharacterized protein n=1 Tax=Methylobacterium soli TaxID=553447 RepID=A0A6L3T0F8_9HYPH|nr:hypothetical protein [Methylobacterium soli]KAB1078205.1 hypothetical protein F6X53_15715 [Methylobacterium soli]GJE46725.1 hypothetical protein AEGHOMDF_5932 [Methylobacterium soli]
MNIPAALVLQSVPFAGLAIAQTERGRDELTLLLIVALGLLGSLAVFYPDGSEASRLVLDTISRAYQN